MVGGRGVMLPEIGPGIEGLIFDLDGTLADTMPLHFRAWMEASEKFGFPFNEEKFLELAGIPSAGIIRLLNRVNGTEFDPEEISIFKRELFLKKIPEVEIIGPVADVVYKYHGRLKMSVGTGGNSAVAELTMRKIGMDRYINIIVASDHVKNHKPAPDTFLECARLMGLSPLKCLVYEDGDAGLEAARSAGMACVDVRPFLEGGL